MVCQNCGREYHPQTIINDAEGIRIENFIPEDGHCFDCGSTDIAEAEDDRDFKEALDRYTAN